MTLREQILAANDRPRVPVHVPEWGVTVYAAPLSSAQQIAYADAMAEVPAEHRRSLLIIRGTTDEAGNAIFTDADAEALAGKSFPALNRIQEAILGK
jgi:hypothetical protein